MQTTNSAVTPRLDLVAKVHKVGYACLRGAGTAHRFESLIRSIGRILDVTNVKLDSTKKTYLCGPESVPLHTDHPEVDLVCWYCKEQDQKDGASILLDARSLVATLAAEEQLALTNAYLPFQPHPGGPLDLAPVLGERGVFFAPWLEPFGRSVAAFQRLRIVVGNGVKEHGLRVRLRPGDGLVIDNRRMLHGRDAIAPRSQRRLTRYWVNTNT